MAYLMYVQVKDFNYKFLDGRYYENATNVEVEINGRIKLADFGYFSEQRLRVPPQVLVDLPTRMLAESGEHDGSFTDHQYTVEYHSDMFSDRARALIEVLDPGLHQFFRIAEAVDDHGTRLPFSYNLAVIDALPNAVIVEESDVEWKKATPTSTSMYLEFKDKKRMHPKLTLQKSIIRGRHVWAGAQNMLDSSLFCSDEFADRWHANGFTGFELEKCVEI